MTIEIRIEMMTATPGQSSETPRDDANSDKSDRHVRAQRNTSGVLV